ncbi:unnamed protein product [Clonostachys solani]|uniref:Uncharacterized protein n=1 Tax=Clonostachys solani TaxID=160281 RepID=A0A9N9YQU4_9HYPO|nr:unnamed protein product [Clonostachys solani]
MAWKEAFELSPSEVRAATPPGTVILLDVGVAGTSSNGLVRQPQPSSDPRDPLNFPFWRKLVALFMVSFYAFVANFTSSVIAPALQLWNFTFPHDPKSYSELSTLVAVRCPPNYNKSFAETDT